ncbi:AraC family transcriptional regulator [Streptomyces sp. NBC_00390]|uniref:AraC family transcriptional regulator n=1 Tax=Streptomyces sp. NBC_00390 TaxID=2975736 RepID=UPI002E1AE263
MGSLIRATTLWGYVDLVRELGGDPKSMLARFEIPGGVDQQDDSFVRLDSFLQMLEASAEELDCSDFGLRLSRWQGLAILGPIAVIARNSQTLQEGFEAIARYFYVHSPALHLEVAPITDKTVRFDYRVSELPLARLRQGYELSLANGARIIRLLGGPEARPTRASFLHDQLGPDTSYAEALGCPVVFEQAWCGFDLPADTAGGLIDNADPETRRIATKYLETQTLPSSTSLADRVAELTRRLLPTGHCTAGTIADEVGMHPRTLQRRLVAEGIQFQDILDRERRDLAAHYLADPMLQLSQIASLLGYAEQASLNRSFRRWFGTTPARYRAALRNTTTRS